MKHQTVKTKRAPCSAHLIGICTYLEGGRGIRGGRGTYVPPLGVQQDRNVLRHGSDHFFERRHSFRLVEKDGAGGGRRGETGDQIVKA